MKYSMTEKLSRLSETGGFVASGTINDDLAFEILVAAKPEDKAMTCATIKHLVVAKLEEKRRDPLRYVDGSSRQLDAATLAANAKMMKGLEGI